MLIRMRLFEVDVGERTELSPLRELLLGRLRRHVVLRLARPLAIIEPFLPEGNLNPAGAVINLRLRLYYGSQRGRRRRRRRGRLVVIIVGRRLLFLLLVFRQLRRNGRDGLVVDDAIFTTTVGVLLVLHVEHLHLLLLLLGRRRWGRRRGQTNIGLLDNDLDNGLRLLDVHGFLHDARLQRSQVVVVDALALVEVIVVARGICVGGEIVSVVQGVSLRVMDKRLHLNSVRGNGIRMRSTFAIRR